ncbi:MAG TPA: GxxExxY protein [Terriglobales bacterium]|jgi:GxxExxY protein|nr:GxxExxY protein [Terriglobales bacterium]
MEQNLALKHAELTARIIGIFYDVYNELGYGFLESVYQEALVVALSEAGFTVDRQVPLPVWFRGRKVGDFRADLLIEGKVLLELKSARTLESSHEAQLLHYLKSTVIEIGLLLNFGAKPQFRRLLFDNERKKIRGNPCESVAEGLGVSAANEVLA